MSGESDLYVVKRDQGSAFPFEGTLTYLSPGTVVRAGHPIIAGREGHFEPLHVHYEWPPERAAHQEARRLFVAGMGPDPGPWPPEPEPQDDGEQDKDPKVTTATSGVVKSPSARTQGARAR